MNKLAKTDQSRQIVESRLAEIRLELVDAKTIPEIKRIFDIASVLSEAAKRANLSLETVNEVQLIRLDAEIKLGGEINRLQTNGELTHGGDRKSRSPRDTLKLRDYGISRKLSSRSQALAEAEEKVRAEAKAILEEGEELSVLALFDELRGLDKRAEKDAVVQKLRAQPLPPPDGQFDVIVVDPPWRYENRAEDLTHRARNPYPDMTLEEISKLPIPKRSNKNCILWLWVTNAFLRDSFKLIEGWRFEYKTMLTWGKDRMGTGDWLRGRTEHCLFAIRGKPVIVLTNQTTLLEAPLREHSRKPDEFFVLVESLCPGTKLDYFGREEREGWQVWGAESNKFGAG